LLLVARSGDGQLVSLTEHEGALGCGDGVLLADPVDGAQVAFDHGLLLRGQGVSQRQPDGMEEGFDGARGVGLGHQLGHARPKAGGRCSLPRLRDPRAHLPLYGEGDTASADLHHPAE